MRDFRHPFASFPLAAFLVAASWLSHPIGAQTRPGAGLDSSDGRPEIKNIFWQPDEVKQGSPLLISVELSGPAREVSGTWLGKRIVFSRSDKADVWVALAGADVNQQAGSFELRVSAIVDGRSVQLSKPIQVNEAQFRTGEANVAQDYIHPTPEEARRVARDGMRKKEVLAHFTPQPLWRGNFERPIGRTNAEFRRVPANERGEGEPSFRDRLPS